MSLQPPKCTQPNRRDSFTIEPGADLFIETSNHKTIRIDVRDDCIEIYQSNGTKIELCTFGGMAGVRIVGN